MSSAVQYIPAWTSHNMPIEGGRKVHLVTAQEVIRVRGKLLIQAVCKRKLFVASRGDPIPDLEKWLATGEDQVCKLCVARARGNMPYRGGNRSWEVLKPE